MSLALRVLDRLDEVTAEQWDALLPSGNPFVSHAFLAGLERYGCLRESWGWQPRHLALFRGSRLCAAVPTYVKTNSHGEFVFDHAWAHAMARAGLNYYPKLLVASPYSPVVGPRLLAGRGEEAPSLAQALVEAVRGQRDTLGFSSAHLLFLQGADCATCDDADAGQWVARQDVQFHWRNRGWTDFDEFLGALKHKKRKNIRSERAQVAQSDLQLEWRHGCSLDDQEWAQVHALYEDTFDAHGNHAALTPAFLRHLGASLPGAVWLALARHRGAIVAMAFYLSSSDTLYGRYWGSRINVPGLHFELCYYRGIEYCLSAGLQRFEPGAQGEHKLARGFIPVFTQSRHAIAHPGLRQAVAEHLAIERVQVAAYRSELLLHSPYSTPVAPDTDP